MANQPVYKCSKCGKEPGRENLFVKRIQFTTMGAGAKVIRSRVAGWLCGTCTTEDADYNKEAFAPTPVASIG